MKNLGCFAKMNYIVGSYVCAPSFHGGGKADDDVFYHKLQSLSEIRGLEVPFWGGGIESAVGEHQIKRLLPSWQNVLTTIPYLATACKKDSKIGLASTNEAGRVASVIEMKQAFLYVQKINQHFGKNMFLGIQIASAPASYGSASSTDMFCKSFEEIVSWNWCGTKILVEHCDAIRVDGHYEKGFLALEEELSVVSKFHGENVGLSINTGRSAIEFLDAYSVFQHIDLVQRRGLLSSVMFSGTTSLRGDYGPWRDLHMPFAEFPGSNFPAKGSTLNAKFLDQARSSINFLELDFTGYKIMPFPTNQSEFDICIGVNVDAIKILNQYLP